MHTNLSTLSFEYDNTFFETFAADPVVDNYPRQVRELYSFVEPKQTAAPKLIAVSEDVANQVGIPLLHLNNDDFLALVTGNKIASGMKPYAMCYGGHQFGHWAGQLGDGRAINLADITTPTSGPKTIQLKGAGPTPYSRSADGFAVLRSSIREFLCSEAMFHLGVPTSRALSLALTGDNVVRDMFYDGNAKPEPGAVVCRVSSSFLRFGSFQLPAARKNLALVKQLINFSIKRDFPQINPADSDAYEQWFNQVCQRTVTLIVHWMRVGFVHGVMNTDNMSIIGETIDYGPYGWIDDFNLHWTPNTTDAQGKRYRFGAQAEMAQWNLFQLANAIYPLFNDAAPLQLALDNFADQYRLQWHLMMASKLGLDVKPNKILDDDVTLFIELEGLMSDVETDMTIFYRLLATLPESTALWQSHFTDCYYKPCQCLDEYWQKLHDWLVKYVDRRDASGRSRAKITAEMNKVNPKFVLRNYLAQQAIEQAHQGDFTMIYDLQKVLKSPYDEHPKNERLAKKRPEWARNKAGASMLSCSS